MIIKTLHLNHDGVEQTFICAKKENEIFNNHLLGKRMNKVMCAACLRYEILLRTFCLYYILPNISFINNMFYECVSFCISALSLLLSFYPAALPFCMIKLHKYVRSFAFFPFRPRFIGYFFYKIY